MKALFLIVYMKAVVGATFGPLPYDMEECLRRRNNLLEQVRRGYEDGGGPAGSTVSDWDAVCTFLDGPPRLGTPR